MHFAANVTRLRLLLVRLGCWPEGIALAVYTRRRQWPPLLTVGKVPGVSEGKLVAVMAALGGVGKVGEDMSRSETAL